jgi:hypothetical protein
VDPVPAALVDELELAAAVDDEMMAWRSLAPPEPWRDAVASCRNEIAEWITTRLLAGSPSAQTAVLNARKAGHGTRPVSVMGVPERVVYRALAKHVLGPLELPDRSAQAYRDFVLAPIQAGFDSQPGMLRTLGSAIFGYVVEADITAFYQYVDHEILRQELHIQSGQVESVEYLLQLLAESEGRAFGVPQLHDPSDWLSDFYIRIVERDLIRSGLQVWRFNDDFRIGCEDYADALDAIERLEESARSVGLTVNTYKTYTPTFMTYLIKNTGLDISTAEAGFDPQDVEAIVADYTTLDESDAISTAHNVIERLRSSPQHVGHIDIMKLRTEELRDLRRAFGALSRNADEYGLDWVKPLFEFAPSLTPRLVQYLISLHRSFSERIMEILRELRDSRSVSEWQSVWLIYAHRELNLTGTDEVVTWMRTQRERGRGRLLAAEASVALAGQGAIPFEVLDQAIRVEPQVFAAWYSYAIRSLLSTPAAPRAQQVDAVKQASPLFRCIVEF